MILIIDNHIYCSTRTKYEELAGKVSAALPASVTGKKEE